MQEQVTRYFHVSYFCSQTTGANAGSRWGELSFSCVGMFNKIDIVKAIESSHRVANVIIVGWQEMNEADYVRFIESPTGESARTD